MLNRKEKKNIQRKPKWKRNDYATSQIDESLDDSVLNVKTYLSTNVPAVNLCLQLNLTGEIMLWRSTANNTK